MTLHRGIEDPTKRAEKNPTQRAGKVTFVTAKSPTQRAAVTTQQQLQQKQQQ